MPRVNNATLALNRGVISRYGLARTDIDRTAMAAETMTNWMPRLMGAMSLRPGMKYIATTQSSARARLFPFIFSADDQAQIEMTAGASTMVMRVRIDDSPVSRPAVTAAVTNGTFTSNVTSWTDSDESGATSQWQTGGYLALLGTGTNAAIRDQQVTVNEANTEHALRIVVTRGPVILRVGSASGGDEYITETTLGTGTHSLAFTPTGNFHIRLMNRRSFTTLVDSVAVEASGTFEIAFGWNENDLSAIRFSQSGDVVYLAADGRKQKKIERRGAHSWSIVDYEPETGPFRTVNTTPITIAPSGLSGDVTLTASQPLFRSTNVGSLFRIQSSGQTVSESIAAEDTFSDPIRVAGVSGQRAFGISITGTFVGTLTLQYSVSEPGSWVDVTTYTTVTSTSYNDGLDNQIIYYRIGIKAGAYTSGTAVATLSYTSGSITGIARVTAYSTSQLVSAVVLQDFGATTASSDWWEGSWSDRRGYPSAVALFEGRLWWAGGDKMYGSIVDAYEDFDDSFDGDAGPILRSIGEGPIDTINWLLPLNRLMVGTLSGSAAVAAVRMDGSNVLSGRSSSFDEPLTPTNFNLKTAMASAFFVQRSRQALMTLSFDVDQSDYGADDLNAASAEICEAGIAQIAVQYKPDVRVHCVLDDGTVAVMIYDRAEKVVCWVKVETDGDVEDVSVMSGETEDRVYYIVKRTINGATVRYIEKWALVSECRGGTLNKQADAFYEYSGASTTTITGLSHLEGESVVVWGGGAYLGTKTVSSGQITGLSTAVTSAIVGLPYTATFKSAKQAFGAAMGTALNQVKKIDHVGLILADTHVGSLKYGVREDELYDLPLIEDDDEEIDEDHVYTDYDKAMLPVEGEWQTDSRVWLQATAPKPATVLAFTVAMNVNG